MSGSASLRNTSERVIIFLLICACNTTVCLDLSGYISFIVSRSPDQVEFENSEHLPRIIANQAAKHTACTEQVTCKSSRTTNHLMNVNFSSTAHFQESPLRCPCNDKTYKTKGVTYILVSKVPNRNVGVLMGNCQQNRWWQQTLKKINILTVSRGTIFGKEKKNCAAMENISRQPI